MSETLLATYSSLETANNVVRDLVDAGFERSKIGVAALDREGDFKRHLDNPNAAGTAATEDVSGGEGAGFGAIVGTLVGAVVGLAAITIPGVGPIIAGGALAALGGAAAGAGVGALAGGLTGGLTASLVDLGVTEDDAHYYAESLRRGSALVSVTVTDTEVQRATDVLHRHNPIDVEERMTQWKASGWKGFDPMADPYTAVDRTDSADRMTSQGSSSTSGVRRYTSDR